ncbi:MAG: Xaa-Pro peptidase family protein [Acidimicrobiia bacterium]
MIDPDYAVRVARARAELERQGADVLLVSLGSDLPYLTGYRAMPLERLTMAVVPRDGTAVLVVPELEAPRVVPRPGVFEIRPWGETEDPVAIVAGLAGTSERALVGDQTWAVFLLELQKALPATDFVSARSVSRSLRVVKDDAEITLLREVAEVADTVAGLLVGHTFAGKTEAQVSHEVGEMLVANGNDTAEFAIVASGPNGASPHHEAGGRTIGPGDPIVVDFGGKRHGYTSDTTRMYHVDEPSARYLEIHGIVLAAQQAAVAAVRPGVSAEAVDAAARNVIESAGYGEFFIHRTGHGIGLDTHEDPYIVTGNTGLLRSGMAFSIEPGIYLPGEFGVRIEDIVVCTPDGAHRLNNSSRAVAVVE